MSLIYPLGPAGSVNIGATGYTAQGVRFNGSTIMNLASLSGLADGQKGTISFWFKFVGGDGSFQLLVETRDEQSLVLYRDNANKWTFTLGATPSGTALNFTGATAYTSAMANWVHMIASWDLSGGGSALLYVNDTVMTAPSFSGGSTINYLATDTNWDFGARTGLAIPLNCDIADFYLNTTEYINIANTTERRKFIDGSGKPVDLGATGSTPTGTAPMIFFSGSVATWHQNKGTGGGGTIVSGSLSASATNP